MAPSPRHLPFAVGERVRVAVSVDELRTMQDGHGGWNHKMAEVGLLGAGHLVLWPLVHRSSGHQTKWASVPLEMGSVGTQDNWGPQGD